MEVKIVEVSAKDSEQKGDIDGSATTITRFVYKRHLACPFCETQDEIFVRMVCTVDFDADYYDQGMDVGIGFSKETASNIEPLVEREILCAHCGEELELPKGMRMIQDI